LHGWQANPKTHLCVASIIRAMPETEIPPVKRGDIYSYKHHHEIPLTRFSTFPKSSTAPVRVILSEAAGGVEVLRQQNRRKTESRTGFAQDDCVVVRRSNPYRQRPLAVLFLFNRVLFCRYTVRNICLSGREARRVFRVR